MYQHATMFVIHHKMCFKQIEEQIIVKFYRLNEQLKKITSDATAQHLRDYVLIFIPFSTYRFEIRTCIKE